MLTFVAQIPASIAMKKPSKPITILNDKVPTLRDIMNSALVPGQLGAGKTKPNRPTKKAPAKPKKK